MLLAEQLLFTPTGQLMLVGFIIFIVVWLLSCVYDGMQLEKQLKGSQYLTHDEANGRFQDPDFDDSVTEEQRAYAVVEFEHDMQQMHDEAWPIAAQAAAHLTKWFGDPCEDYDPTCILCQKWKAYHTLFDPETEQCSDEISSSQ